MESKPQTYCMICTQLKSSATVTSCCLKVICQQCSQGIKKTGNKCPNCRNSNLSTEGSVYLTKTNQKSIPANDILFQTNCLSCSQLAHQALVFSCCGCLICSGCKENQSGKECPNCRKNNYELRVEPFVIKFLREISSDIQFFVKTIVGGSILLRMKEFDTAKMLFNRVSEKEGNTIEQIRLVYAGKNLQPTDATLKSYHINNQSTVQMLLRLKGG